MNAKKILIGVTTAVALLVMISPAANANSLAAVDLTPQLNDAGLAIQGLRVMEVGGVAVLRGATTDPAQAVRAGALVQALGYTRVANLIRIIEAPDDAAIERTAERRLAMNRSLDGCQLRVDSQKGIVNVAGQVDSELQKDVAVSLLRNIEGVRQVTTNLRQK